MRAIALLVATVLCAASAFVAPAQAADEPIVIISRFFVAPGQEKAFEERSLKVIAFVRKAEPDVIYRVQKSTTNPSQYVFYEVYPSQAALERHNKETLPAFGKQAGPRPEGMLAKPPENEKLAPLGL